MFIKKRENFVSKLYTAEELVKFVENVSSFTHAHDRSKFACIFSLKLKKSSVL